MKRVFLVITILAIYTLNVVLAQAPLIEWQNTIDGNGEIEVVHYGSADASVTITIEDLNLLTGGEYKVYFDQQHYYLDVDGIWKPTVYPDAVGKNLGKVMDCSGSVVAVAAIVSATPGTIDLIFTFDMNCGSNWIDGLWLDMPDSWTINSWDAIVECSFGINAGQNCINMDGILDPTTNTLLWGTIGPTGFGAIEGGQVWIVNVNSPIDFPADIPYGVYDDGYDGTIVDITGTATATELGYEFKTQNHWNLSNLTKNEIVLEDQTVIDWVDIYALVVVPNPIIDGFEILIKGSYDVPKTYSSVILIKPNGAESSVWGDQNNISDFLRSGWLEDAKSTTARGFGSGDIEELVQDYECRWTGVYKTTPTVINGMNVWEVESGGSMASLYSTRNDDLANHPLNPNPGVSEPFLVRIPFEVWNKDTGEQINFSIRDRIQLYDGSTDIYAFNPYDRMYTEFVNTPYDPVNVIPEDGGTHANHFTWNLVWWGDVTFTTGDVLIVKYANPITFNDYFLFTANPFVGIKDNNIINDFRLFQNSPNPFNPSTSIHYSLPNESDVNISVYDMLGRKVHELISQKQLAGKHSLQWNGTDQSGNPVSTGIYLYQLQTGTFTQTKKMVLMR